MNALSFPSSSRILRSADFRAVYDHGFRVTSPFFAAFCREREGERDSARLGLTVPRAVGGAVVRNRIKRRLREIFRAKRTQFAPGWDIVLNPRKSALHAPFADLERAFGKLIEKCGNKS